MDVGIIVLAVLATLGRVILLIGISIILGWGLAYAAVKSRKFENIYIPLVNVLESIPVLAFFPLVLVAFIYGLGGGTGTEIAADFLVFDAVAWNIWIGAYQAFKTVPSDLLEVARNYRFGFWKIMRMLYIPHSVPRITSNLFSSFSDAMFYIMVSEVFAVGLTSYHTFGIGTLLTSYLAAGNNQAIFYSLAILGIAVAIMTLIFHKLSIWAIAKFGTNTEIGIKRHRWAGQRWLQREWRMRVRGYWGAVHARRNARASVAAKQTAAEPPQQSKSGGIAVKLIALAAAIAVLYIAYSALKIANDVSPEQWSNYISQTPTLLLFMGADYVRVIVITLAALVFAVLVGYELVIHKKLSAVITPIMQVASAYPAPAYFPLLFIATLPFISALLPTLYSEVYVFILGFLSCFYYIFFDFWTGVQSIPSEFWEIMNNYRLGTWTRIKKIVLPGTLPYLVTGLSSTINSAWGGIAIGEYWRNIYGTNTLQVSFGMMKYISLNMANNNVGAAAWVSLIFAVVIIVYSLVFTRNFMDLARKRYVIEEGVYAT